MLEYTFTNVHGCRQTVNVPREYLVRTVRSLGCSIEEACELYAYDEGYTLDETANELNAKADTQKKRPGPKRKKDPVKCNLVTFLSQNLGAVKNEDGTLVCDYVSIVDPQRLIQFKIDNNLYELTLSRKRK